MQIISCDPEPNPSTAVRTIEELLELVAFHEAQVARQDSPLSRERALSYLKEVRAELAIACEIAEKYLPKGHIRPEVIKAKIKPVAEYDSDYERRFRRRWRSR